MICERDTGRRRCATHNQALNALVFLYREVLKVELKDIENAVHDVSGGCQYADFG